MNDIKLKVMLFMLAFCMLASQAFAISVSFGGGSESGGSVHSSTAMSAGSEDFVSSIQTLSIQPGSSSLSGTLTGSLSSGSWANQYHQADSGPYHVATYAYMDQPDSFTYSFNPVTTSSSASISESLTATNARNLTYGGFAYNSKDYAAVQLMGEADSISYFNNLYAGSKGVSALQTFSGTGCNLTAISWAERGNLVNERWDQFGPDMSNATYSLFAGQMAQFENADIKSYASDASIKSDIASSSQSADISSSDFVVFDGIALKGTPQKSSGNEYMGDSSVSEAVAQIYGGKNLTYTSKAKSSSSTQSTEHVLKGASADTIYAANGAFYSKYSYDGDSNAYEDEGYGASQQIYLDNAELGKNGIKGSASISGTKATSTQSADISSSDYASVEGYGQVYKLASNSTSYDGEGMDASSGADVNNVRGLAYTGTSTANKGKKISSSSASATQTLKAKSNTTVYSGAAAGYSKYHSGPNDYESTGYHVSQNSYLSNVTLGKSGLQASASISSSGKASASQKSDITSVDLGDFSGYASSYNSKSDEANFSYNSMDANTYAEIAFGSGITHSGDSASSIKSASASQNLVVKSAESIVRDAGAYSSKESLIAGVWSSIYRSLHSDAYARAIHNNSSPLTPLASMSGKDSVSVDDKGAKLSQDLKATGINIGRSIYASQSSSSDAGYEGIFVGASTEIGNSITNAKSVNSLNGKASADLKFDTSASLKGSWKADVSKELGSYAPNFRRLSYAYNLNGDSAQIEIAKVTNSGAKSVIFTESATATKEDTTVT